MKWESAPETSLLQQVREDTVGLAVLAALAVCLLVVFLLRRHRAARALVVCRWRADRTRARKGFKAWRCKTCGKEGYSSDGRKPKACLRGLGGTL